MSAPQEGRYDSIARRWLALVERRQQHFIELCNTGRWRHYYSEGEFLDEMRQVLRVRNQWAAIVGLPPIDADADDGADDAVPIRRIRKPARRPAMPGRRYAAE